ncbi:MAG: ATP-binding cassette domain-containing protein [Eubacteriales bacterium]|nr:ATP-binding cassette domain-containing protein [Eubacteriales bacterium]
MTSKTLVQVKHVSKEFKVKKRFFSSTSKSQATVKAVRGVSFDVFEGETLGVIGESGCGKTTLGRILVQLISASEGEINYSGIPEGMFRQKVQMIFQDPYSALDPRMSIYRSLEEPLRIANKLTPEERLYLVRSMLEQVGMDPEDMERYPRSFSGGQLQRICIARTLLTNPMLVVCDEVVSALDVSIQSQILNLLNELKLRNQLTYVFISHNMSVIQHMSDRIAVMYFGSVVELGTKQAVFERARHPYTQILMSAVPQVSAKRAEIKPPLVTGELPKSTDEIQGCAFQSRCPYATAICAEQNPALLSQEEGHFVACHHPLD